MFRKKRCSTAVCNGDGGSSGLAGRACFAPFLSGLGLVSCQAAVPSSIQQAVFVSSVSGS